MSQPKKHRTSRLGGYDHIPPYTDQKRKVYEFSNGKRKVRSGGETKVMTNTDLVRVKQFEAAMAGNSNAQRDYLRQDEEATLAREHYIRTTCESWSDYIERFHQVAERARDRKEPPLTWLPHPVDIRIDWANGVMINGPIDEVGRKRCEGLARFRDALFIQQAMEDADNCVPMDERPSRGGALVHAMQVNLQLPLSFRLSDIEVTLRVMRLQGLSKRNAFVACRAAWRAAGFQMPRGQHYGSLEAVTRMYGAFADYANALRREEEDDIVLEELIQACLAAVQNFGASIPKRNSKTHKANPGTEGQA